MSNDALRMPADSSFVPLFFGYAPPRRGNDPEKTLRITQRRVERLSAMSLDGLILYDLQDESPRTDEARPFPYLPTIDPLAYSRDYLSEGAIAELPRIIYRAVTTRSPEENDRFIRALRPGHEATVLVGAPSHDAQRRTGLGRAYELYQAAWGAANERPALGGVTIPERHARKLDEHRRLERKGERGCSFFVSQCVYDAEAARNLLSDYHYATIDRSRPARRIVLTLSPCGSRRTLDFMRWLGVGFPRWLENDLERSGDILDRSVEACRRIVRELSDFCLDHDVPFGFNVESVSIKRTEIDAAGELASDIHGLLRGRGVRG